MVTTLERHTMPPPAPTPDPRAEWRCQCGRYLGRWLNGTLHVPGGGKYSTPLVHRCPNCGKLHRKLTAPKE